MAAANLNRWVGTGNLTRDPELKTTPSGTQIANMRVAVNGRVKRGDDWQDKANFFDVVVFGAKADLMGKYLHKGSSVAIDGRLDYQEWEKDDVKHNRVVIIANTVQFTDGAPRDSSAGHESPPASSSSDDDDIPF